MRYVPNGHARIPTITHRIVRVDSIQCDKQKNNIYVAMCNHKREYGKVFFREDNKVKVDLAYIVNSDVYNDNLDKLRSYLLDLYYVINRYLNDSDIAEILYRVLGGSKSGWCQWLANDMVAADRFSDKHVTTLKAFRYILKSPRLKQCSNDKHIRWFTTQRVNLSELENVII